MTDEVPHPADAEDAEHDPHHGHAEPGLGPIDWPAWGYAVLGLAVGLLIVGMFYVAIT